MIDTHCHLNLRKFFPHPEETIRRAVDAGVNEMIVIGIDVPSSRLAVELAEKHPEVYATVGIHPTSCGGFTEKWLRQLEPLLASKRVVGYGEIGLDYYVPELDPLRQASFFIAQLKLARQFEAQAYLRAGDFGDVGPMGGYAYTFVLKRRWFATASLAVGGGLSVQHTVSDPPMEGTAQVPATTWGPGWHLQMRAAMGYNSQRDQVSLSFNEERVNYLMTDQNLFRWHVGNIRFNVVHRFSERLPWFDRGFRWLKKRTPDLLEPKTPESDIPQ